MPDSADSYKAKAENLKYTLKDIDDTDREDLASVGSKINVTDDQLTDLKKYIEDKLRKIEDERNDVGLYDIWQQNEDMYYGDLPPKTFPFEQSSNVNVPLVREKVDVVTDRILLAKHSPEDIWEVLPVEINNPNIDEEIKIHKAKQKFLTHEARNEIKYEESDAPATHEAVLHGTGWLELPWHYEVDMLRDVETYEPEPVMIDEFGLPQSKNLEKFLRRYPTPERAGNSKDWHKHFNRLKEGKGTEFVVEYEAEIWNNPKPAYIPIRNFIISPFCKDIAESTFHGKQYELTGDQLVRKKKDGIFDQEDPEELAFELTSTGEIMQRNDFLTKSYKCYTLDIRYSFTKEGVTKRYLVDLVKDEDFQTYDENGSLSVQTKILVTRLRRFPYWHNRSYFIPQHISERKSNSIYREGLCDILSDTQDMSNVALNFLLDALLFGSIPIIKANESMRRKLGPQLAKGVYPGMTLWLQNSTDVMFETTRAANVGGLGDILKLGQQYGMLMTGVGENLSGKENPADPRAPAEKTKILVGLANQRLSRLIRVNQRANREVAYQLIELYYQHVDKERVFRVLGDEGQYTFPAITRDELRQRSEYNPVGSIDTLNKDVLLQKAFNVLGLMKEDPFWQNPAMQKNKRFVYENIFRDMGGVWEKSIAKMLPTEEQIKEYFAEIQAMAIMKAQDEQLAKQRQKSKLDMAKQLAERGVPREQIEQMINERFGDNGASGPAQGVPRPVGANNAQPAAAGTLAGTA